MRISDWSSDVCSSDLIFVLDAVGEVNPVRQLPDRRLEDVCGRRRTMWLEPATVEPEQRGFLLAAGDRNAELVFAGEAQRGLREALQQLLNRRLVQRLAVDGDVAMACAIRSEEHTSELQSLMRISYAVFCLKKKTDEQREQHN